MAWEVVGSWLLGLGCLENYLVGGMCSVDLVFFLKGRKRREEGGWSCSLSQTAEICEALSGLPVFCQVVPG